MIDALYITAEDAIRTKKAAESITEGQPVSLDDNGQLIAGWTGGRVDGVSKLDSNEYADFAFGEFGAFGTGKLSVVTKGIVRVKDSVYNKIEVNSSTTEATDTHIHILAGVTFAVNDLVYVDAAGLITNAAVSANSIFGKVTATPTSTAGTDMTMSAGWLEILVDPMIVASIQAGATGATGMTGATGRTGATGMTGA